MAQPLEVESGSYTPESQRLRRRLAEAMMLKGMDTSPIQSPWQGVARMMQAIMGGYEAGELDRREKTDRDEANSFIAGRYGVTPPAAGTPSPSASGGTQTPPALNFESQGEDPLIPFLRRQEGFRSSAYDDFQQRSIGYGTRANPGETSITREEAERRLENEVRNARRLVRERFPNLTPGQETALTDLTFNAGTEWMGSGLGQAVAQGNWPQAQQLFTQYVNAGGQPRSHLAARRLAMVGNLSPGQAPAAAAAPASSQPLPVPQSIPGATVASTPFELSGAGPMTAPAPAAPAASVPSPAPTPAPTAAAPARMTREQATQEAFRRLGARGDIIRRALTSRVPGVQRAAQAEIEQAISAVMAEQPPANPLDRARIANIESEIQHRALEDQERSRALERSDPATMGTRIHGGLERLAQVPVEFGRGNMERAIGPLSGADISGNQGYVSAALMAFPTLMTRMAGSVRAAIDGGASPTEVRNRIAGDMQTLAGAIKPLIRAPGEGPWTNQDQERLERIVGNLATSSTVEEYNRALEGVRQRIIANFGFNIPEIRPQQPSANQPPMPMEERSWADAIAGTSETERAAQRELESGRERLRRATNRHEETLAPAAPVAPATPEQRSMIPPRPSSVPGGSMYNPARRQWRDPAGRIYDETGQPLGAQ